MVVVSRVERSLVNALDLFTRIGFKFLVGVSIRSCLSKGCAEGSVRIVIDYGRDPVILSVLRGCIVSLEP